MPDTHDERQDLRSPSGRFANFLKASEHWSPDLLLGSSSGGRPEIVVALGDMRGAYADLKQLRKQLAAVTARAEKAEARIVHLDKARDAAVSAWKSEHDAADELQAELGTLGPLRTEWSTANNYADPSDDIVSERLARDRVASRPEIHAAVVSRQIYAGPWRTERVATDAAQDGLSETLRAEQPPEAPGVELEFGKGVTGLCAPPETKLRLRDGDQPLPTPNSHPAITDLVVTDMEARRQLGITRYGTPLQPHNGRDALRDAYEEGLDLVHYLRQVIYERDDTTEDGQHG